MVGQKENFVPVHQYRMWLIYNICLDCNFSLCVLIGCQCSDTDIFTERRWWAKKKILFLYISTECDWFTTFVWIVIFHFLTLWNLNFWIRSALYEITVAFSLDPWHGWLTIVLQCYNTVGWVIWPVKSCQNCVEWDYPAMLYFARGVCAENRKSVWIQF